MFGHVAMDRMFSSMSLDEATADTFVDWDNSMDPENNPPYGHGLQSSEINDRQESVGSHHPQDNLLHYPAILPATLREHRNGVDEDGSPLRRYLCHHFKILKADSQNAQRSWAEEQSRR